MSARLYCGTSGFSYPSWKPGFYPKDVPLKKFLAHYASRLNAVESNYTFRSLPSERALGNWMDETPKSFLFAVKAHQSITHFGHSSVGENCKRFFDAIEPLRAQERLGPVLFQFPPALPSNPDLLRSILSCVAPEMRVTFEFRHVSWFSDTIYRILEDGRAALCLAESDTLATPHVVTADFICFRLRKSIYSPEELAAISDATKGFLKGGKDAFLFFKHHQQPTGPAYAETLLRWHSDAALPRD